MFVLAVLAGLFGVGFLLQWAWGNPPLPQEEVWKRMNAEGADKVLLAIQQPFPHVITAIPPKEEGK